MIPPQIIDKIFDVAPIEEVVGEYVTLKRAGANYKGLCPFHDDKSPSMSVSPSKGIFKCFSCGEGGNIFHFIMQHEGLSYPLAIKFLAERYNIEIEEGQINVDELQEEARVKDGVFACLEFAKNHFYERLNSSQDGKIIFKPYLTERGIHQQTIDEFYIGLSGLKKDHLLHEGIKNGYSVQQLFDAGLVKKINENQGIIESNLRDTFLDRIVFPIFSISGKVLGFGGRIIKKDTKAPKYLNSPETIVYEKRKELYGLSHSKQAIRKNDTVYLVEGYMDVVSLYQSGVENVVAVSGTAFTEDQARLLKRFSQNVTLLFDGDVAGVNASLKHIQTILAADLNVQVVLFPADEDPDSFIQKRGISDFYAYVKVHSKNFVGLIQTVTLNDNPTDPIKKAEAARTIAENIAALPDPLKRAAFITETSNVLDIPERIIIEEVNKFRVSARNLKDREERRNQSNISSSSPDGPPPDFVYQPDYHSGERSKNEDAKNYQEEELLKTLILHADKEFEEGVSVAAFIFKEFEDEEIWPVSSEFSAIYREAYSHFKEYGTFGEYFNKNYETGKLAADANPDRHSLSKGWEKIYEKYVKTDNDNYKSQVIDNLNYLKLKHIDNLMRENQEKIKTAQSTEDIIILQQNHRTLQEIRKKITDQIGTVII